MQGFKRSLNRFSTAGDNVLEILSGTNWNLVEYFGINFYFYN